MSVSKLARILVVDDERDISNIIAKGLRLAGFEAQSSASGTDVASNFRAGMYDLIILDIKMPDIDGIELYGKIRSIDKGVKICFLTAFDSGIMNRFKQRFPYTEVPYLIRKPIELPKLIHAVKTQLNVNDAVH